MDEKWKGREQEMANQGNEEKQAAIHEMSMLAGVLLNIDYNSVE